MRGDTVVAGCRPGARLLLAALVLLLAHGGCAARPWSITYPADGGRAVGRGVWIGSYQQALASIIAVMDAELGLPLSSVTLHVAPHRAAFEDLLLANGYQPQLARDTAATMDAIGGFRRILLNEQALRDSPWPDRVALLSHELVHVLQYELGGGVRGASDQWLREGFADWVTARVMETLGLGAAGRSRSRAERLVSAAWRTGPPPSLESMSTFPAWVALQRSAPGLPTYELAFLAVDVLVARHGLDAVVDYFRRFAQVQDRAGNFERAFGESIADFEAALGQEIRPRR
jgi:hypothetical protein